MELNLGSIVDKLTWHPYESVKRYDEYGYAGIRLPLDAIVRDREGELWLVGDMNYGGCDDGCGCCSNGIDGVEVAYLSELLCQ